MARRNNSVLDAIQAFGLTYGLAGKIKDDMVRQDVGDAAQTNQVTESVSGDAAAQNFQDNYVPQEGGPATAAEYLQANPGVAAALSPDRKASFSVGADEFDTRAAALSQASARNTQAAADVYSRNGRHEEAQRLRLQAIQTRGAEQKQADDDELRGALATGKLSVANPAPVRNEAIRSSISTGADITGASSVLEHKGPVDDTAPAQPYPSDGIAPAQPAPQPAQAKAAPASEPSLDNYLRTTVPRAVKVLIKQGRLQEAKQASEFIDSEEGRAYATQWINGVRKHAIGDSAGALADFELMYNQQIYNDGNTVKLTPLEGGKQYRIDQIGADGQVRGSQVGDTASLANQAASALSPMSAVKFHAEQQAQRAKEAALLDRQIYLEGLRQDGQDVRDDRRDERLARRLEGRDTTGGLTLPQQRGNAEIDAARDAVAGLDPAEIRRRTSKTTNTGRENHDFDPALERAARLAGRRKVGADDVFDKGSGGQPAEKTAPAAPAEKTAPAIDRADVAKRFRSERSMDSYTLGKETPNGVEVLSKGKVIGHYK